MKICAVVSEFNPFHNGHKYLLEELRRKGYDAIICVMSGNFVQRGVYAICDKRIRAELAVNNGADLVLSIPFPWSSASAEFFARAAIRIIDSLGIVETVAFGSESGNIDNLKKIAKCIQSISREMIRKYQKREPELSYARVRQLIFEDMYGSSAAAVLEDPNDILAIEYLKSLEILNSTVQAVAVKREASSHDGEVCSDNICSSSYIRMLAENGEYDKIRSYVPWSTDILSCNLKRVNASYFFNLLRGAILSRSPEELAVFAENGGGFEFALYREMLLAKDYETLFEGLRSRHLTDAKIRRTLLYTALGVKKSDLVTLPEFTEVLATSVKGNELLAMCRKSADISVLSKTANIKNATETAQKQFKLQRRSEIAFESLIYKLKV